MLYLLFTTNTRKGTEMQEHYTPKGKHLTIDNRRLIERWKNENKSNREIAGLLGRRLKRFILKSKEVQLYNK
ncbi:putative transposase-IS1239 [Streptococcus pneumoniae GA17328]|nr:putative transposase-IS1239 [Streptococcus pneumoniae GA17328]